MISHRRACSVKLKSFGQPGLGKRGDGVRVARLNDSSTTVVPETSFVRAEKDDQSDSAHQSSNHQTCVFVNSLRDARAASVSESAEQIRLGIRGGNIRYTGMDDGVHIMSMLSLYIPCILCTIFAASARLHYQTSFVIPLIPQSS